MDDSDPRLLYQPPEYPDEINIPANIRQNIQERPRPASAREVGYGDMFDSGMNPHLSSPGLNQPYGDHRLRSDFDLGVGRTVSLDRYADPYATLRGNFDTMPGRIPQNPHRLNYTMKTLSSNPGINTLINQSNPSNRRAHSFDVNLEKQGLSDYNALLAAAGIGGNTMPYGSPPSQFYDYTGLTTPGFPSIGGLDYISPPQNPIFPSYRPNIGLMPLGYNLDPTILQRECIRLQQEVVFLREKLSACTSSIRTFWSPELKRERAMRKEENAKYAILADHLHQLQLEKQTMLETLQNVELELHRERDYRIRGRFSADRGSEGMSELDTTKRRVDDLSLENKQLKRSLEDSEKRITSIKSSLTATEESLRRLIEAVKAGKQSTQTTGVSTTQPTDVGPSVPVSEFGGSSSIRLERIESDRSEIHRLRNQLNEACTRGSEAERKLIEKNFEFGKLKEEFDLLLEDHRQLKQENDAIRQDTRQTQTLQSLVDTKESKIMTLENEIRLLEDELARLRDDGLITPNTSTSSGFDDLDKTIQAFRSNERLLKSKVEMLGGEISKRDCEIYTLQSRLEMTDKQHQDQVHHINVLKEEIKTKEHKIAMITADVDDFRKRIKEKESQLDKKSKALTSLQTTKRQLETELNELKEQSDIKERKLNLLQRKIENLEDLLNEKDAQIVSSKVKLSRFQTDKYGLDTTVHLPDEIAKDIDKAGERYRLGQEGAEDSEVNKRFIHELRKRLEIAQRDLEEKSGQLLEMREELSELRTHRLKHETELNQLQTQLNQRTSEVATIQMEKQMRVGELEVQMNHYLETNRKLQSELDRILRNLENEKQEKERQTHELQEEINELQNNLTNLKRNQQAERKKQTQLLEETRQREENAQSDIDILKSIMTDKDARIRELEQALRESVRLTTEREIYASGREDETRQLEMQIRELRNNLEQVQRERNNLSSQLSSVQEELSDRENQLKTLEQECFQNYLPELEKLRRSNHEANLRVAAMVKLTQGREHALTDQDRAALSGIPMFPNLTSVGGYGLPGSGISRAYVPAYQSTGAISPHLTGSAFQLIGNPSIWPNGRASAPGQSLASPDVVMLTKMLQEKENQLQQHMQELMNLRFRNSEQEIRMKAMQRELDAKTTKLGILEATKLSAGSYMKHSPHSPGSSTNDVGQLRRANYELTMKCTRLQMELEDRERHGERPLQSTDFSEMAVLRRELVTIKAEKETEAMNMNAQLEEARKKNADLTTDLRETRAVLAEKESQIRIHDAEKHKEIMERAALQKKYETVLNQLSEKTEKLQHVEAECQKCHLDEIKRQKSEIDDQKHHITYLQNTIQERENRIEIVEKESFKLKDELASMKKKLNSTESDAKALREDMTYRDERFRQLQAQHNEELSRLRSSNQELNTRIGHLELRLDEKDHELNTQAKDLRRQTDEVDRLHAAVEDANSRFSVSQKRVEERETRLRKLENENHDLLDEIHVLRKGNTELESEVDSLRQRLLDRHEQSGQSTAITATPVGFVGAQMYTREELERTRKQYNDLCVSHEKLQKQMEDLQIQYDQVIVQRNAIKTQLEEEVKKRAEAIKNEYSPPMFDRTLSTSMTELKNELERKEAQIVCLTQEVERLRSGASLKDRSTTDETGQNLLITDLQVRLRQALEEKDHLREELSLALSQVESSYIETNQQLLSEKQNLQEQITNLTLAVQNANSESERFQREFRQACARVQQLSRQLQETQNNSDAIARQRDSLREQLEHFKRTGSRGTSFGGTSVSNLFGLAGSAVGATRPASAGPGSYETHGLYSTQSGSTSHLSRELDRLHREYESVQGQLQMAHEAEQNIRKESEQLQTSLAGTKEELEQEKRKHRETQARVESLQIEIEKLKHDEVEKIQTQQKEFNENFKWAQQQLNEKAQQVENLNHQLANSRHYCSEMEQRINELTSELKLAESRMAERQTDSQRVAQMELEYQNLKNSLQARETEVQHLNTRVEQLSNECSQQTKTMEQMAIEMSNLQGQYRQAKQEAQEARAQQARRDSAHSIRESDKETIAILQEEIREAAIARERLEEEFDQMHTELQRTREQLKEKTFALEQLETSESKQQNDEIARLQKELTSARAQIEDLGGSSDRTLKGSPLKREIDTLKREIMKRDEAVSRLEKDCQEKHLRRMDSMQAQLRRYEEETANLNKVLDEQRLGIEERDNMINQLRANQTQASSVELERLRNEHARCKQQFDQQARQIATLGKQLEDQSDEILTIKLESLTASLCEKEANIALMEMTAPKNASTDKALDKLRTERDHLQIQQRQLANTKALLEEEKKSRR